MAQINTKITAEKVREILRGIYSDHRRYAIAEEVGLQTGYSHRRLDMMVLDCFESNGFRIDGYEIKVSMPDLRRELEDPEKHVAFYDVLDYFWLACPANIVDLSILPKKWGVLAICQDGTSKRIRKPLALHDSANDRTVPRGFFAAIVRAIQKREPAAAALKAEYQRGLQDSKLAIERRLTYAQQDVLDKERELKDYRELQHRFRSYGNDLTKRLDEFERFRSSAIDILPRRLNSLADLLNEVADDLSFKDDAQ